MSNQNLEWGNTGYIEEEQAYIDLPEGQYYFTVTEFKKDRYEGGTKIPACNKAVVLFEITTPDGKGRIWENYFCVSTLAWKMRELFEGVGIIQKNEPISMAMWDALVGRSGVCDVGIREYKDRDGNAHYTRYIKKILPNGSVPQQPIPQQAPQQNYNNNYGVQQTGNPYRPVVNNNNGNYNNYR